jgi:hypothetical protein
MRRRAITFLLCLLVLGWPALATGQDVEKPPKALWDAFPLEPSVTPSPASAPASTPARGVTMRNEREDGIPSGALIALMVAAAGIGAVAARMAARRVPRTKRALTVGTEPAPAPRAEAPSQPASVISPPPAAQRVSTSQPPSTPVPALPAVPAKPQSTPLPLPVSKRSIEEHARPTAEPTPTPELAPAPESGTRRRFRRNAKAAPEARPATVVKKWPPRAPQSPTPKLAPSGRFVPAATTHPGAPATCSIKLGRRPPMGRFVAVAAGGRIVARSPVFKLKRTEDDTGPTPPEALRTLVAELTAAGWRKTGSGRTPWDLRFEREPQGTVTRRASPPRA